MGQNITKFQHYLQLSDFDFINKPENEKRLKGLKLLNQTTPNGGEIVIAIYLIVTSGLFKNPLENGISNIEKMERMLIMEMRGAIFDKKSGKCIRRPFCKFENLGSLFTKEDINWSDIIALEKLDGSLIAPYIYNGLIIWATKKGHNPDVDEFVANSIDNRYIQFINDWTNMNGWSCMFEWCSPNNKIILQYNDHSLTLIGMRNIDSGEYMPYDKLASIASDYNVPVVKKYTDNIENPETFLAELYDKKGIEGCVLVQKSNGIPLCKVKCKWYSGIAKNTNYIGHSNSVPWEVTINETWDDIIGHLEPDLKANMIAFNDAVIASLQTKADEIRQEVLQIKKDIGEDENKSDKTKNRLFHERIEKYGVLKEVYFNMRKDMTEDPFEILIKFAKKMVSVKNLDVIRNLVDVNLNDYKTVFFKNNQDDD